MQRLINYGVYTLDEVVFLAELCRRKYLSFNDTGTYSEEEKKEIWRVFDFMVLVGIKDNDIEKLFPRASQTKGLKLFDAAGGKLHKVMHGHIEDGGYAFAAANKGGPYCEDPAYLDFLHLKEGDTYVDLMGGAGDEAIGIARKHPGVRAVSVDLNSRNTAEALRKAAAENLENVSCLLRNVRASKGGTAIPAGSVRAVTISGFSFFRYDREGLFDIFDEAFRILAPDGRIFFDYSPARTAAEADVLAALRDAARKHGATITPEAGLDNRKRAQYGYKWYGFRLGAAGAESGVALRKKIEQYTQTLVDFLAVRDELPAEPADLLLVLGNSRIETVEKAAELYKGGHAKRVVVSGGIGRETPQLRENVRRSGYTIDGIDTKTEAEIMREILIACGIPPAVIMTQDASTHTRQSVINTRWLLERDEIPFDSVIVMTNPLMQRRSMATFNRWFGAPVRSYAYAPFIPDVAAMSDDDRRASMEMAQGEFERFEKYGPAGTGDIAEVKMSHAVREAYLRLRAAVRKGLTPEQEAALDGVPVSQKSEQFDPKKAESWISAGKTPEGRRIRRKIIDRVRCVTFAEFKDKLDAATERLNGILKASADGFGVVWDNGRHKSRRWVYRLAQKQLVRPPAWASYYSPRDTGDPILHYFSRRDGKLPQTLVIFDNAAYSGLQISETVASLYMQYDALGLPYPRIIAVLPYITQAAINKLRSLFVEEGDILYEEKMPTIKEIFTEAECAADTEHLLDDADTTLVYADYDLPDEKSFNKAVALGLGLEIRSPYTQTGTGYYDEESAAFDANRAMAEIGKDIAKVFAGTLSERLEAVNSLAQSDDPVAAGVLAEIAADAASPVGNAARDALVQTPGEIDARLAEKIEEHLKSIRANGLRPRAELGIPSNLGFNPLLSGNVVNPAVRILRRTPQVVEYRVEETGKGGSLSLADLGMEHEIFPGDPDEQVARKVAAHLLLYANNDALLPVVAERPWDQGADRLPDILADRVRNSIVCVTALDKATLLNEASRQDIDEEGGPLEYHASRVGFDTIRYILVPAHLGDIAKKVFAGEKEKLVFVGERSATIPVYSLKERVTVPDYESALRQIEKDQPGRKLWAHIVRLPAPTDEIARKMSEIIARQMQERETPVGRPTRQGWREDMVLVKGLAYEALGMPAEAAECYRQFLQLNRDCAFYEISRTDVESRLAACVQADAAAADADVLPAGTGRIGTYAGPLRLDAEQKALIAGTAEKEKKLAVTPLGSQYFMDLMSFVTRQDRASPRLEHKEALVSVLALFADHPPELFSFGEFAGDLFGCAFSSPNAIVLHEAIADHPVAVFHEYCEQLIRAGALKIDVSGERLSARDAAGKPVMQIRLRSADALRQVDKAAQKPAWKGHYLLRALTREMFGDVDRDLSERIKDLRAVASLSERALAGDMASVAELGKIGYSRVRDDETTAAALRALERVLVRGGSGPDRVRVLSEIKNCIVAKPHHARDTTVRALAGVFDGRGHDPLLYEYAMASLKDILATNPSLITGEVLSLIDGILQGKYDAPFILKDSALIIQIAAVKRPELIGRATIHALTRLMLKQEHMRPETVKELLSAILRVIEKNPDLIMPEQVMWATHILASGKWPDAVNDQAVGVLQVAAEQEPDIINQTHIAVVENCMLRKYFSPDGYRTAAQFFRYATENNPSLMEPVKRAMLTVLRLQDAHTTVRTIIRNIETVVDENPMLVDETMVGQLEEILSTKKYGADISLSCVETLRKITARNPAMIDRVTFAAAERSLYEESEWPEVAAALENLLGEIVRNCRHVESTLSGQQERLQRAYRWFANGLPFIRGYYDEYLTALYPDNYLAELERIDVIELGKQIDSFRANAFSEPLLYMGGPFDQAALLDLDELYHDLSSACPPDTLFIEPPENVHAVVAVQTGMPKTGTPVVAQDAATYALRDMGPATVDVFGQIKLMPNGTIVLELSGPRLDAYMTQIRERLRATPLVKDWYQTPKVQIQIGRIISEKYTPAQILRIRAAIDAFNEYGPFDSLKIGSLTVGRLNARGESKDTRRIYLAGVGVFKPLLKKGSEKNLYGTRIGGGLVFNADAPSAAIAGDLKYRKIQAAKGIGRTIEVIQRYFSIIREADREENEKFTTDISDFKIEFRTNIAHYAYFAREKDPATGRDILKIIVDIDLLNTKKPSDLRPFLAFLLGHEGSHAIVEDEFKAQMIDKERFAKFSTAHQQAVLRVLQDRRASSSYISELKVIHKRSVVSRSLKLPPAVAEPPPAAAASDAPRETALILAHARARIADLMTRFEKIAREGISVVAGMREDLQKTPVDREDYLVTIGVLDGIRRDLRRCLSEIADVRSALARMEGVAEVAQFARELSHDLGNMFMVFDGAFQLVSGEEATSWRSPEYAEQMDKALHKLIMDVQNFRELAGNGGAWTAVDVRKVLQELFDEFLPLARMRGLRMSFEADGGDFTVTGNAPMLKMSFNKLLENALKYTKEGTITIRLSKTPDGERVLIEVQDSGIGIARDDVPKIFQGMRGETALLAGIPGTGWGLRSVKRVVGMHGGKIDLESVEGIGSVFRASLPAGKLFPPPAEKKLRQTDEDMKGKEILDHAA